MALSGTLETFGLPDVLRLLSSTKKTGLLALDGDRGTGQVWVDGGEIVAAAATRAVVDDVDAVLFELLRFADAAFEFDASATAPESQVRRPVDDALEVAEARLEEWREIEAVVPSLDVRVRMVPELDADVTVTPDVWRVLATVGTGASGHEVARHLEQGEFEVCRGLRDLVETGMVEVTEVTEVTGETHGSGSAGITDVEATVEPAVPTESVAEAFATMVQAPEPAPVPVYEVPFGVAEPADEEPVAAPDPFAVGVDPDEPVDDHELLSDLSLLSPKAAAAVEATWSDEPSDEPSHAHADAPDAHEDEGTDEEPAPAGEAPAEAGTGDDLDQNLLLRFLSSAKH